MEWLWDNADKLGNLAQVAMMFVAAMALLFAILQIHSARRSQYEATATEHYHEYLNLAIKHPHLALPDKKATQSPEYRWFCAFVLTTCDEVINAFGSRGLWKETTIEDLRCHADYLESSHFQEDGGWRFYSPELKKLFEGNLLQSKAS